jgi:hypothetical protein
MNKTLAIMAVLIGFMVGCNSYPNEAVKDFRRNCIEFGMDGNECDCQIKRIQRMVPYEEYKKKGGSLPIEVEVEAAKCVDQHHYPLGVVDAFIAGCVKEGGNFDQCACMIRRRQKIQPYADFVRDGLEGRPTPKEVVQDSVVCMK